MMSVIGVMISGAVMAYGVDKSDGFIATMGATTILAIFALLTQSIADSLSAIAEKAK